MPQLLGPSTRVVDIDGLTIDECVGNVASHTDKLSIAVVKVAEATAEPWLTLDYDEWMVVLNGYMEIHSRDDDKLVVKEGETVFIARGERFRPVFPEGGVEYVPVCIPAFKPERCLREEDGGINTSEVAQKLGKLHENAQSNKMCTPATPTVVYHMCQVSLWKKAVEQKTAYFPPTFQQDGFFTHATAVPARLLETANHFYTGTEGDWICLELSTSALEQIGIRTMLEEPKSVGAQAVSDDWKEWACPHVYGGIPTTVEGIVTKKHPIERSEDGSFLRIEGLSE